MLVVYRVIRGVKHEQYRGLKQAIGGKQTLSIQKVIISSEIVHHICSYQ